MEKIYVVLTAQIVNDKKEFHCGAYDNKPTIDDLLKRETTGTISRVVITAINEKQDKPLKSILKDAWDDVDTQEFKPSTSYVKLHTVTKRLIRLLDCYTKVSDVLTLIGEDI